VGKFNDPKSGVTLIRSYDWMAQIPVSLSDIQNTHVNILRYGI